MAHKFNIHQKINIRSFFPKSEKRIVSQMRFECPDNLAPVLYKEAHDKPISFHHSPKRIQFKNKF